MDDQPAKPFAEDSVAVWFLRYNRPDYDLMDDEDSAARLAVAIEEEGNGSILGVQFADGRTHKADQWRALHDARRRSQEFWKERQANPPAPRPTRKARDPFMGKDLDIEISEPGWLGWLG
jgi:hypothetical protein